MKRISFPQVGAERAVTAPRLSRYAWLSVAAAVLTIGLKSGAYLVTGSVGLLSDAAESVVNLVAAVVAFVSFTVLVPGAWTVEEGHDLADQVEVAITKALPDTTVHTHIEPRRTS